MSCCVLQLDANVREAFDVAYDNIYAFHVAQKSGETNVENMKVSDDRVLYNPPCDRLLYPFPMIMF